MRLTLSTNISRLRKEHAMTQEQLAEALGVTFAAVSKWERGISTPELGLIAEMADLFGVSLDALVGFEVQNGGAAAFAQRIDDLQCKKKHAEAMALADTALRRHPNDFRVVYHAGSAYEIAGLELKKAEYVRRGIALLERSVLLLSQNTAPDISEFTIQDVIAQGYLNLGQTDKGIELLKKYNDSGIHDPLIALAYTRHDRYAPKEAAPYLTRSLLHILTAAIRTMTSYARYYHRLGDEQASLEALLWLIHLLESVKIDPDAVAYVDKILAPLYAGCANFAWLLGRQSDAEPFLRRAYALAEAFDHAPIYQGENIRFCIGDVSKITVYDELGDSAKAAVTQWITQESCNDDLRKIWKRIVEEEGSDAS